jgi:hypothetical protein
MTNFELLVVAIVCVAVAVWWTVTRTSAAAAPLVLALIMLITGVGGPIWEWSKWSAGAGLPPNVFAASFSESKAVPAFLWAAIGAGLAALLIPRAPAAAEGIKTWLPSKRISTIVLAVAILGFVGFVYGSGPSIIRREVYLESDGNLFVLRIFWPVGVIFGLMSVALTVVQNDRKLRLALIAVSVLWFIGPLSTASRLAVAFPLIGGVLMIYQEVRHRRLHPLMIAMALGLLATSILTFAVILQARSMPHGLLNIPKVANVTISDALNSTDSFLLPLKQLAASVFASVPNAEQSTNYGVDLNVLLANANPLPGSAQPPELERYWPYEWVPLSFTGEWYGATGWAAQFLLFGAIGWVLGYSAYNIQRSRFQILSFVPTGIAVLIGSLAIQYSSRMVWRLISIAVFLFVISYLVRSSQRRKPSRDKQDVETFPDSEGDYVDNNKVNGAMVHSDILPSAAG